MKSISPQSRHSDILLEGFHKELNRGSLRGRFIEGWGALESVSSPAKMNAYKVFLVTYATLSTGFILGSTTFGCLAMMQAVHDFQEEGKAPIIGHFSEWTMQALLTAFLASKVPYEIIWLGTISKADAVFKSLILNPELLEEERVLLYTEKLDYQANQPQNSLFTIQNLPNPGFECCENLGENVIYIDAALQKTYEEIKEELNLSSFKLTCMGWKELTKKQSPMAITAMKAAIVGGGVLLSAQYVIYSMGIYWSGEEAIEQLQMGENPSIGGHCLEWFAEMLGVGNLFYTGISEIAKVGSVKHMVDIFQKHIKNCEDSVHADLKAKRLREVLAQQVNAVPKGYLFSLPSHLRFR
ncbi:hypothetical protein N9Y92_01180 [Chlamydiales bacterium]|nr:hypothetical protein [Chlamydiales bacterium]